MAPSGISPAIERRLLRIVAENKALMTGLEQSIRSARGALGNAAAILDGIEANRSEALDRLMTKIEILIGMANDPTVLVRSYGVNQTYHSARNPCGKANPAFATEMPWGEAKANGYRPCSFCGSVADRDAEVVHRGDQGT